MRRLPHALWHSTLLPFLHRVDTEALVHAFPNTLHFIKRWALRVCDLNAMIASGAPMDQIVWVIKMYRVCPNDDTTFAAAQRAEESVLELLLSQQTLRVRALGIALGKLDKASLVDWAWHHELTHCFDVAEAIAAKYGNVRTLEALSKLRAWMSNTAVMDTAAYYGQIPVLEWGLAHHLVITDRTMKEAFRGRHLAAIEFLLQRRE